MAGLPPAKLRNPGGRGAKGGTRTPTGLPAGTYIQCVYQFRHSRVAATPGHPRKHGTGPAHRMPPTAATLTSPPASSKSMITLYESRSFYVCTALQHKRRKRSGTHMAERRPLVWRSAFWFIGG